jgi:hypothetical protein
MAWRLQRTTSVRRRSNPYLTPGSDLPQIAEIRVVDDVGKPESPNSFNECFVTRSRKLLRANSFACACSGKSVMLMTFLTISVSITSSSTRTKSASSRPKASGATGAAPRKACTSG